MSDVSESGKEPPLKKRSYSRNGCKVCKKRKLKCDEVHPVCGQCLNSNRSADCLYEKAIKFNNSRIFTINSKSEKLVNLQQAHGNSQALSKNTTNQSHTFPIPSQQAAVRELLPLGAATSGHHLVGAADTFGFHTLPQPTLNTLLYPGLYNELMNDLSSLINDLNELINSDVPFLFDNGSHKLEILGLPSLNNIDEDLIIHAPVIPKLEPSHNGSSFQILSVLENSISQLDIVSISNFFQLSGSSSHINYLKTFVTKVHVNLMPFTTLYLHNAFMNNILVQLKKSPYLLSAILAISARYEYYQLLNKKTDQSSLKIHGKLRSYYLSSCLNSLDSVLRKKNEIVNNIESLLFTTLILLCDFSSSTGSNWRAHLRGAKDLLLKYSSYTSLNSVSLLLSRTIFSSMEMLLSMTVSIGGTIHNPKELDQLLNLSDSDYGKYLSYYGLALDARYSEDDEGNGSSDEIVIPHTYNMYFGHSNEVTRALKEIILSLEAIRRTRNKNSDEDLDPKLSLMIDMVNNRPQLAAPQILKVFLLLHKASNVYIITKKSPFEIPHDSKYHPVNASQNLEDRVPVSCYFYNEMDCKWYSWYDLCHQSYVDAATLRFMLADKVLAMRSSATLLQHLVKKILANLFFVQVKEYSEQDAKLLRDYYGVLDDNDKSIISSLVTGDRSSDANGKEDDEDDDPNRLEIVNETGDEEEEEADDEDEGGITDDQQNSADLGANGKKKKFVKPNLDYTRYLRTQFDHRIIMIQWPLLICGICAYRPIDKLIIETCFNEMISYGIGSAEMSLAKVKKNWLLHGISYGDKISDNLFWDDGDSVPFS